MGYTKGDCKGENCKKNKNVFIVNKIHQLCQNCNWERIYPEGKKSIKSSLKPISKKEQENKSILTLIYTKIDLEREHICTGCKTSNMLNHSHLIPRSSNKSLESDEGNITYHCQDKCHPNWESNLYLKMSQMNDFEINMEYIYCNDRLHFNFLISKFQEQGYIQESIDLETKFNKIYV